MAGQYKKMQGLAEDVFRRKAAEETNRQIRERCGLTKNQINIQISRKP